MKLRWGLFAKNLTLSLESEEKKIGNEWTILEGKWDGERGKSKDLYDS